MQEKSNIYNCSLKKYRVPAKVLMVKKMKEPFFPFLRVFWIAVCDWFLPLLPGLLSLSVCYPVRFVYCAESGCRLPAGSSYSSVRVLLLYLTVTCSAQCTNQHPVITASLWGCDSLWRALFLVLLYITAVYCAKARQPCFSWLLVSSLTIVELWLKSTL